MWVVYEKPRDFPESWVARRWAIYNNTAQPTPEVMVSPTLAALDDVFLERGYAKLARSEHDEPHIVCSWV